MKTLLYATILFLTATSVKAGDLWPQDKFAYVVAYCYDHSQDKRGTSIIQKDGTHHKGIISAVTLRLSPDQDKKLRRLLLVPPKTHPGSADCFLPHHAFVFYDSDWNPKAHISICFLCGTFKAQPKNSQPNLDLVGLQKLVEELGIPVYRGAGAAIKYTKLFQRLEHSEQGGARQPATAADSKSEGTEKPKPESERRSQ